jgi:acetyltransferase
MSTHNLQRIFRPARVAVIGGSQRQGSVGDAVMRNLLDADFRGTVIPVNPKYDEVHGLRAYQEVGQLSEPPDLAVVCTPAKTVPAIVGQCRDADVGGVIILSAGFREAGKEGAELEKSVRAAGGDFEHLRAVGPNCLGILAPHQGLNASFAAAMPPAGHVAFVSQSGALCTAVLDWALQEQIGFSHFVSIGNMLDVDFADLIDYFAEDSQTRAIVLYIESITNARRFMSASRAYAASKPIIAYKAGRFSASAQASASHTGAMAGEDAVFDAAFRRAGIERVFEVGQIFACAELLARHPRRAGPRLAIITNAGGPGVMAADALLDRGGILADLSEATIQRLNRCLPEHWSGGNPVDVLGDATQERYEEASRIVLEDEAVDAALVILTPQAMTRPDPTAVAIGRLAPQTSKPLLAAWMGGPAVENGHRILNDAGIPTYAMPEEAIHAFLHLVSYTRNRRSLHETPRELDLRPTMDREAVAEQLPSVDPGAETPVLGEAASKQILKAYGIPVAETAEAASADEAIQAAERFGYPVALKIVSPQITHKSDAGGVALNLDSADQVQQAYQRILQAVRRREPDAEVQGVTVQPMVQAEHARELIVGAKQDATFGAVMMIGLGGTAAEVLQDRVLGLPPLNEPLARQMLQSLRSWPLLEGYRGQPGVDLEALIEVLVRLSCLVADHPAIDSLDINPLLATPDGATALDARVFVNRRRLGLSVPPYPHLAIRPPTPDGARVDLKGFTERFYQRDHLAKRTS